MHSFVVEQRACPRCGNRRTGRFWRSRESFCFNCRSRCDWAPVQARRHPAPPAAA
jgi:hypothetical protein